MEESGGRRITPDLRYTVIYITKKQQQLLIEMHSNHNRTTRKEQETYPSHRFYDKVSELKGMRLVDSSSNGENKTYHLTMRGVVLVKILCGENWLA